MTRIAFLIFVLLTGRVYGQQLPGTAIKDSRTGRAVPFNQMVAAGRVTMVTFWGTWCAHGKHQVKTIAAKLPEWRKQVDFDFVAIAEDQVGTEHLVAVFISNNKWTFPCYTDARAMLKLELHFFALPYTMIVDSAGKVVFTHTGYDDGDRLYRELMRVAKRHNRKFRS